MLKAKYCRQVAGSCSFMQTKNTKNATMNFDLWPLTMTFSGFQRLSRCMFMHPQVAATQKMPKNPSDLDLWPTTLKFNRLLKVVKVHHAKNPSDLDLWPMTLKFNRILEVVKVHAKFQQVKCSGSWVIVLTNCFAPSCNGDKSENPVLWPWHFTCDLDIQQGLCGCQGTCSRKISSS